MRTAVRVCVPSYGHFWLWLVTYESSEEMMEVRTVFYVPVGPDEEVLGMFTRNDSDSSYLGIMRIAEATSEVILHESVHAASCMANKVHGWSRTLSHAKEEAIAYATTAIANAVYDAIYPDET